MVAEGRKLVKAEGDIKWQLGDLALEVAPMGDTTARNGALDQLQRFADEIECQFHTLRDYRRVSAAWSHDERSSCAWSVHQVLSANKDLIRPGMTLTQARQALGYNDTARSKLDDREKEDFVRQARENPELVEAAARDPIAGQTLASATARVAVERNDTQRRERKDRDPRSVQTEAYLEIITGLTAAMYRINRSLKRLKDDRELLSRKQVQDIDRECESVESSIGWFRAFMESGDISWDEALTRMLAEEPSPE